MKKVALLLLAFSLTGYQQVNSQVQQKQTKKNVILDVDTSGDDLMAILFLLAQPDVDIKAITIVHGVSDVEKGTEIVLRTLALTGHSDIPVIRGADVPMEGNNAFPAKWQPPVDHPFGLDLPPHSLKPSQGKADEVISSLLKEFKGNISVLALGPLTNIAEAFEKEPGLATYVNEIYVSDGGVYVKGAINMEYPAIQNTVAGWNLWVDPEAASLVFGSAAPITLVPLDLTAVHSPHPILLKSGVVKKYNSQVSGAVGQFLASIFNNWIAYYHADTKISDTEEQAPVWDLVAAEIYCDNNICTEWQQQSIGIKTGNPDTDGQIILLKDKKPNVRICLGGNQDLFAQDLIRTASKQVLSSCDSYKGRPFAGVPQEIPGRVQCEYYDLGGEGVAYHDSDIVNNGSGKLNPVNGNPLHEFRINEGVDISYTKNRGIDDNPYNDVMPELNQLYVGWTEPGEWLKYSVNVKEAGDYTIGLMYTSNRGGDIEVITQDGVSSGPMPVQATYNDADTVAWRQWHHWNKADILGKIHLKEGIQVITLQTVKNGNMNYDYLEFEKRDK